MWASSRNLLPLRGRLQPRAPPRPGKALFSSAPESPGKGRRNLKVAFFGTDHFALPSLEALHKSLRSPEGRVSELQVVHPVDRPRGRGLRITPEEISRRASELHLPKHPVECNFRMDGWEVPESIKGFDLGVVISFGHFLPERVISNFSLGMINVHGSLLPRYRGASPIQAALFNGDPETGVSVVEVAPKRLDAGRVLKQLKLPLSPDSTYESVARELSGLGAIALMDTIDHLEERRANPELPALLPSETVGLDAPKLHRSAFQIEWESMTAAQVVNRWRGVHGWHKVHSFLEDQRQILSRFQTDFLQADVPKELLCPGFQPGDVVFDQNADRLLVRCKEGWASLLQVLPAKSSKPLSATRWARTVPTHKEVGPGLDLCGRLSSPPADDDPKAQPPKPHE